MTDDHSDFDSGRENPAPTAPGDPALIPISPDWDREITLDEARRLYVRKHYHRFAEVFGRCDAAGKMQISLAVAPFFFGSLWFFYRKMYVEGFSLMCAGFLLSAVTNAVNTGSPEMAFALTAVGQLGLAAFMVLYGKALYWKAVDRQIEWVMRLHPRDPERALARLQATGGVNVWIVVILAGGYVLLIAALVALLSALVSGGSLSQPELERMLGGGLKIGLSLFH